MIGKLGRRPPKRAPSLKLAPLLTGVVPDHPTSADHFIQINKWVLGGNDNFGTCGPTSVANDRLLISTNLLDNPEFASDSDVFDLYRRSGNPGFVPDPLNPIDDNGVDMQTMLEAVHNGGFAGKKCVAFAQVDHTNLEEMRAAIAIFGDLLLGVNLEQAQYDQTDAGLWDYKKSAEWGGHAVMTGRYADVFPDTGDREGVITWAEVVDMTDAFINHQVEEAWVVIWPEHFGDKSFIEGIKINQLAVDYQQLTGDILPIPEPEPTPIPDPSPDPAPTPAPTPAPAPDWTPLIALLEEMVIELQKIIDWFKNLIK